MVTLSRSSDNMCCGKNESMAWAIGQQLHGNRSTGEKSTRGDGRGSCAAKLGNAEGRTYAAVGEQPRACEALVGSITRRASLDALIPPANTRTLPADNLGTVSSIAGSTFASCTNSTSSSTSGETSSSAGAMLSSTLPWLYAGRLAQIATSSTLGVALAPSLLTESNVALPLADAAGAAAGIAGVRGNAGQGWRGVNNVALRATNARAETSSSTEAEDDSASERRSMEPEPAPSAASKNVSDFEVLRTRHQTSAAPRRAPWWLSLLRRPLGERRRRRCSGDGPCNDDNGNEETVSCHRDTFARNHRPDVASEQPEIRDRERAASSSGISITTVTDPRRPRHLPPTESRRQGRAGASTATSISCLAGTAALLLTATVGVVRVSAATSPVPNTELGVARDHQQRQQWLDEPGLEPPLVGPEVGGFGQSEDVQVGNDVGGVGGVFRPRLRRRSLKKKVDRDDQGKDTDLKGFSFAEDGGGGSSKRKVKQAKESLTAVPALVIGGNFTLNGKTTNVAQYDPVR